MTAALNPSLGDILNTWTEGSELCNTSRLRRGALRERRGALMRYKLSIPRRLPPGVTRPAIPGVPLWQ
jgi:hypothetical protein